MWSSDWEDLGSGAIPIAAGLQISPVGQPSACLGKWQREFESAQEADRLFAVFAASAVPPNTLYKLNWHPIVAGCRTAATHAQEGMGGSLTRCRSDARPDIPVAWPPPGRVLAGAANRPRLTPAALAGLLGERQCLMIWT